MRQWAMWYFNSRETAKHRVFIVSLLFAAESLCLFLPRYLTANVTVQLHTHHIDVHSAHCTCTAYYVQSTVYMNEIQPHCTHFFFVEPSQIGNSRFSTCSCGSPRSYRPRLLMWIVPLLHVQVRYFALCALCDWKCKNSYTCTSTWNWNICCSKWHDSTTPLKCMFGLFWCWTLHCAITHGNATHSLTAIECLPKVKNIFKSKTNSKSKQEANRFFRPTYMVIGHL